MEAADVDSIDPNAGDVFSLRRGSGAAPQAESADEVWPRVGL